MGYTWSRGAEAVLEHTAVDWDGIWSLLYAAGKGTFHLSLQLPIAVAAELAYAAMDICQARDEVGWAHPEVPITAIAVDLGPLGPVVDLPTTGAVLVDLLTAALDRLTLLAEADPDGDRQHLARQVAGKARAAREVIAELTR
ncbi:MAG TPA: hypothetical protein VGK17_24370 [Propionicimonas sp.]|jgi:hypothetical protein